jgi:hypothetical protein
MKTVVHAIERVAHVGIQRVALPVFFHIEDRIDRRFDERANIDTGGRMHLDDLTIDSDNTDFGDDELIYFALPILALRSLKSVLPQDLSDYVFVDFGSGKGRVLTYASAMNFKKIIGVEFAAELHERAAENIEHGRHPKQLCSDIEVLHIDAVEFAIPDENCVFFLFNPFEEDVLRRVVDNIQQSFARNPRSMYVVYHNPQYAHVFDESSSFEPEWSRDHSMRSVCYEVAAYSASATAMVP